MGPIGPIGPIGATGTSGILGSAYFYGNGTYSLAIGSNVVFDNTLYNSAGSGVTQTSLALYTLLPGTYAIDWQVRGIPGSALPITFTLVDVTDTVILAGSTFSADLSAGVEQAVTSSYSIVIPATIEIGLRNDTGDVVAETAGGSPARSNRSLRFLKIA
jgi:hypothetical protein